MFNFYTEEQEVYRGITLYHNAVEAPEELIEIGLRDDRWKAAEVIADGQPMDQEYDPFVRNAKVLHLIPLVDYDPTWYFVAKGLKQFGYRYANTWRAEFKSMEFPQMLHYPQGSGFYLEHIDSSPGIQRIFSAVLYLNTVEEGGETVFPDIGVSIKPVAGTLAMFPSNYLYRHQALVPESGDKFSIVSWYREDNG